MPMDVKPKAPPRGGGKLGMNPLFAGIIIGLLLGIFLALGVATWLNRTANPFVEKTKPVDSLPTIKAQTPATGTKTDPANLDKPRFEFYQLLPGEMDAATKKPAEAVKDAAKESVPLKSLNETLFLQAGAFQNELEAENLKAKIAFAGFEANVKPVNVAAKGTLYRVRLGPYKSQEEVNRIKSVLSQNGINATVVKPD